MVTCGGQEITQRRALFSSIIMCIISTQYVARSHAYGTTYVVGDEEGWTFGNRANGQPVDYSLWASRFIFLVNDVLVFNYQVSTQTLYSFDNYDAWKSCNFTAGQLLDDGSSGSSQWYLPYEGYYDFASGIYCSKGQKFRIYAINDTRSVVTEPPVGNPSPPPEASSPETMSPFLAPGPDPGPGVPDLSPAPPGPSPGPNWFPSTATNSPTAALELVPAPAPDVPGVSAPDTVAEGPVYFFLSSSSRGRIIWARRWVFGTLAVSVLALDFLC